jgi:HK97 gp10 family phage protein
MADRIVCQVDLHGVEEDLLRVGPKIAKRLFRRALKAVGMAWTEEVKSRVPVDTGALRDSIDYVIKTSPKDDSGSVQVGPTYDSKVMKKATNTSESPGVYGMFVEFGLKSKKYPRQPYMRPTFDVSADRIIQLFAENLREDLEDAVKE